MMQKLTPVRPIPHRGFFVRMRLQSCKCGQICT